MFCLHERYTTDIQYLNLRTSGETKTPIIVRNSKHGTFESIQFNLRGGKSNIAQIFLFGVSRWSVHCTFLTALLAQTDRSEQMSCRSK